MVSCRRCIHFCGKQKTQTNKIGLRELLMNVMKKNKAGMGIRSVKGRGTQGRMSLSLGSFERIFKKVTFE